jgi:hypothetical protein
MSSLLQQLSRCQQDCKRSANFGSANVGSANFGAANFGSAKSSSANLGRQNF